MHANFGTKGNMLGKTIHNKSLLSPVLTVLFMLFVQTVFAQTSISVPYSFGFEEEEAAELANWVLNPGSAAPSCEDQWIVGEATANGGRRSLYISNDGYEAQFGAKPDLQYAYRDFTIPEGRYEFSFDYRCMGAKNSTLNVGITFISSVQNDMVAKSNSSSMPASISGSCNLKGLNGSTLWKNTSISFNAKQTGKYRVFFAWSNANNDTTLAVPVGACIDNIQLATANCAKPKNLKAEARNDSVMFTWQGTSEQYIFERRKRGTDKWYVSTGLTKKEILVEGLSEGAYDFRVRGVCNDVDTSAYCYLNSYVVYYPDRHCIDYIHLHNENIHGAIGKMNSTGMITTLIEDTIVDFGEDDKFSRHTLNVEPDRFDPRTGNRLRTIPEGAFASVRLGNWNLGAEFEQLSFEFVADSFNNAIVMLQYAVVLEDPGHDTQSQPRFTLEILDENDNLIDPTCGAADFYADATREGWHTEGTGSNIVTWKDWTTVGLNLKEMGLSGQLVKLRFTTYDCAWSGHYGYAYFTLDCASATITNSSCGSDTEMKVNAPDGFTYQWYNKDNELVAEEKQLVLPSSDTTTYRCHLSFVENPACGFDLYTASKPRYPVAGFTYKWAPTDCENKVRFTNTSHVMNKIDDYVKHNYDEPCDEYQWNFGSGVYSPDANPVVVFPKEGGDFHVTLTASIAEGRCVDEVTMKIHVPAIGDTLITTDSIICKGDFVLWGDRYSDNIYYAAADGSYRVAWKSVAGCDSICVLNLRTIETTTVQTPDTTVCAEVPLIIDGKTYSYSTSGKFYRFFLNAYGCDSTRWCNVTVLDSILPVVTVRPPVEENAMGTIIVEGEGFEYYTVNGGEPTTADSLENVEGGSYTMEFFNDFGCVVERIVQVSTCLPGCIFQRWGNVLSLKDSAHVDNALDYAFDNFQWLRNGEPIPNATKSYLYLEEGLKTTDAYVLRMRRVSNGEIVQTCAYYPKTDNEVDKVVIYPSPVRIGQTLTVKSNKAGSAAFVSMIGETVQTNAFGQGTSSIPAPSVAGVYVVKVTIDGNIQTCRISVIE